MGPIRLRVCSLGILAALSSLPALAEEVAVAGVEFALPDGFQAIRCEPPILVAGVARDLGTERARLLFFVPPAPANVAAAGALTAVRYTVAGSGAVIPDPNGVNYDAEGIVSERIEGTTRTTYLMARRLEDRLVAVALLGRAQEVDARIADARRALLAARSSTTTYPTTAGRSFRDESVGFTVALPIGFEVRDEHVTTTDLVRYALPDHFGLPTGIEITLATDSLDVALEGAIQAERARIQAESAENVISRCESFPGRFPCQRLTYQATSFQIDVLLLDTARHRVRFQFVSTIARAPFFEAAFERCMTDIRPLPRRIDHSKNLRAENEDGTISLRPPRDFDVSPGEGTLLSLRQIAVKPPAAEIHVRLAGLEPKPPKTEAEAIQRATQRRDRVLSVLADSGFAAVGDVTPQTIAGTLAARYRLEREDGARSLVDLRTVLNLGGRDLEVAVSAPASDFELLRPAFEATIATLRASAAARPTELQAPTALADGKWSLAAPEEWIAATTDEKSVPLDSPSRRLARFEPAERLPGAALLVESAALEDTDNPLIGSAERLRNARVAHLELEGASVIRVESIEWPDYRLKSQSFPNYTRRYLQFAYSLAGQDMREVCFAYLTEHDAMIAIARCAADRFSEHRELFIKSISTLEPKSP